MSPGRVFRKEGGDQLSNSHQLQCRTVFLTHHPLFKIKCVCTSLCVSAHIHSGTYVETGGQHQASSSVGSHPSVGGS